MTRTSFAASAVVLAALLAHAGCDKPSDESCRKAISNMRMLIGTDSPTSAGADIEGDVRRCKGGSKKKAVDCAAAATTLEELRACDFMKIPAKAGGDATGSAGSSAAGSAAGSSAAGSDPTGSAAGSPAAGSDSTGSAGSANPGSSDMSGSAGSGSDMSGSAAGSGAGSSSAAK